jgi:hypothetical protein
MQCPGCGYDVDDAAVFCPQCRFPFREVAEGLAATSETGMDFPGHGGIADDNFFEEPQTGFTRKELRQMEIQLLQPAMLVVLIISLFTYTVISTVSFVPITIGRLIFGVTGIICLACGLVAGLVFFMLGRRSLAKFQ